MISIPFDHFTKMLDENIFLQEDLRTKIKDEWKDYTDQKKIRLYDRVTVAYHAQIRAFEEALEENPNLLAEIEHKLQTETLDKLKQKELKSLQKAEVESASILSELKDL